MQMEKLNYAFDYISKHYIEDVALDPLVEEAIKAVLERLDPHSSYLTREEMMTMLETIDGEFSGIGSTVIIHNDTLIITRVTRGSPAERAELRRNDRVLSVDGHPIVGLDRKSAVELLRGAKGSIARLEVLRRGEALSVDIKRDEVARRSIGKAHIFNDGVAYIPIHNFSKSTVDEFQEAVNELGRFHSMVIDLRGNIGGLLESAVRFSELFLRRGEVILSVENREKTTNYLSSQKGKYCDTPLVVLIDEATASASEIFVGAMQDQDRAVIVGRRSYGKGLIQKLIKFRDESGAKITIARYRTPSGRVIQRPYRMGERKEYDTDTERYNHPDSMRLDTLPRYTTLKSGREVYGGGGIMPDIYIPADTAAKHDDITAREIEEIMIKLFDHTPIEELRAQYPTFADFVQEYNIDEHGHRSIVATFGNITEEGVERIMARLADELYDMGYYYYILYGSHKDKALLKALEVLSSQEATAAILGH